MDRILYNHLLELSKKVDKPICKHCGQPEYDHSKDDSKSCFDISTDLLYFLDTHFEPFIADMNTKEE